jgi:two-component system LytT family sensor kinase
MKRSYLVTLHICYWLYTLNLLGYLEGVMFHHETFDLSDIFNRLRISYLAVGLGVFYANYFIVLPAFFKTKRFTKAWIAWLCLLALGIAFRYLIEEVLFRYLFGAGNYNSGTSIRFYIIDNLYFVGIYIVMSTVFWTADYWIIAEREKALLQQQKFDAETAMLKNQVNPHFLFNTLNNIYSLSYKKNDKAPESILKLSALMRYMLKDSNTGKVLLTQEIDYLHNFIGLQRLRYADGGYVDFHYSADQDSYMIAPLLLIPFVENGFKHGVVNDAQRPLVISVTAFENKLDLNVSNKKSLTNKDESSGIGLHNVKLRLALLYGTDYKLAITETDDTYLCHLTLNMQA